MKPFRSLLVLFFLLLLCSPTLSLAIEKRFRPFLRSEKGELIRLSAHSEHTFQYNYTLPTGYKINEEAPSDYQLFIDDGEHGASIRSNKLSSLSVGIPFTLDKHRGNVDLVFESTLYYCKNSGKGLCLTRSFRYTQPLWIEEQGSPQIINFSPSQNAFAIEE